MSLVQKTSAGKRAGSLSYVLSDATVDRYGDTIDPQGWQLDNFKANPIALFNHNANAPIGKWANIRIEGDALVADFVPVEQGTSRLGDEILSLIKQDILRATSVGFRAIAAEPIDPKRPLAGVRYTQQELLETSIVSVPANPAAVAIAKSLNISDDTMTLAFGEHARTRPRDITTSGGHARHQSPTPGMRPMTISKQIEDVQDRLNNARDQLVEHTRDPDHDTDQAEALQQEVLAYDKRLTSLKNTEQALAARALVQSSEIKAPPLVPARRPLGMAAKEVRPRDLLARAAAVHLTSYVKRQSIEQVLDQRYPGHEATAIVTRAAVAGATTTTTGWAAELVEEMHADFLSNLDPSAVFPRLAAQGTSLSFGPNAGTIRIPSRATTPSISGSFTAEASPIPVRRLGLTSIQLVPHKLGVISVYSREIANYSNPSIEGIIREAMADDTAITLDGLLLDAVAATAARPAGLTNGVAALTATTGGGATAILGDIKQLTAPFYAVNAGRNLVFIINPAQALSIMMTPGPDGTFGWSNQFTGRFSIIESTNVPAGHVYMIDAADFVSVSGPPEFEVSETASVHLEDTTPLNISSGAQGSAVVATPVQSMFQTAQIAIRMLANVTWQMRRTGMVQHIASVTW